MVSGMARVVLVSFLIGCISWHYASAILTMTPSDTESKVNDSTYFNCSTNISSKGIHWSHDGKYVYAGGSFYHPYLGRFRIEINNSTGAYNLVIPSVEPQDIGEYSCQDDGGHGKQSPPANLIVLADEPTCRADFIRCGIHPDEVQLSCSVEFHGNVPPQMEWRKAGENSPIGNTTSSVSGSITTHSVAFKTDLSMNDQLYVCQTTQSTTSQYQCNSETIRLHYAFGGNAKVNITMDKEVKCSANSSQSCTYTWLSGGDSKTVTTEQTLKPTRVGSHRCEAMCAVGNTSCVVNVTFVEVFPAPSTGGSETTDGNSSMSAVGVIVGVSLVIVGITVIVIICLCIRCRRNSKQKGDVETTIKAEQSTTPLMALCAEDTKQVKQSDTEPNKEEVVNNKTDQSAPLITSRAKDSEQLKQSHVELEQGPKGLSLLNGKPEYIGTIARKADKESQVSGVTVLKDKLFVASENSTALEVYDVTNDFAWIRRVPIPGMVNPYDLASSSLVECIFIIDSKHDSEPKEIIRFESDNTVGKKWLTGDDFGNMSVSSESNIILCVSGKKKLIEYTKDGEKIREIALPDKVHPQHAIKLINGNFLISHGYRNGLLHQVCTVDVTGEAMKHVKSFGLESGSSLQLLNEPRYLIVDKEGYILVVDKKNNRVLLLDSDLNAKRDFLTKYDGVANPDKMCLCEATRNLFVADSKNVLIFRVK